MGLFGPSHKKTMSKLLSGPSKGMADGMEDSYRSTVQILKQEGTEGVVEPDSPKTVQCPGLYMARLFGASFMLFPFMRKHRKASESVISDMMNATTGVAIEPIVENGPYYCQGGNRIQAWAEEISEDYMLRIFKAVTGEYQKGGSTIEQRTNQFEFLEAYFFEALGQEFVGGVVTEASRSRLEHLVASTVGANMQNVFRVTKQI